MSTPVVPPACLDRGTRQRTRRHNFGTTRERRRIRERVGRAYDDDLPERVIIVILLRRPKSAGGRGWIFLGGWFRASGVALLAVTRDDT
jgi:hypothetical protein